MNFKILSTAIAALLSTTIFANTNSENDTTVLEPITVSADLRDITADKIAASISILNELELQDRGTIHFGDVLLQLPNVNFSAEGSRPRHIQIRGMGERDEYTGAPNASVGFAIDDIDFSGIGMAANLFDVKQVEVLRGPQSTRYGANALAGLVNIQSNVPTSFRESLIEFTAGQDDLTEIGLMTSGSFDEDKTNSPLYRFALFKHDSDSFYNNRYLNKDDTNGRDELYLRGKLNFTLSPSTQLDITLLHANIDNGYDAWSLDNSASTQTDNPGKDQQKTNAAAAKLTWDSHSKFELVSTTTFADSNIAYSYDGDWVHPDYWATPFVYNFENKKERNNFSQEVRFISKPDARIFNHSTDWLTGIYFSHLTETNDTTEEFEDDFATPDSAKSTAFEADNIAIFGQLDHHINQKTTLSGGIRIEHNRQKFSSSLGDRFSPSDTLFGGHISLSHDLNQQHNLYATLSRGYKAGGFNAGLPAGADKKFLQFDQETALNYEIGLKSTLANNTLKTAITAFYMDRESPQFDGYSFDPISGWNWVFFTENLDTAKNYGIEAEFDWQANASWNVFGSIGLLKTKVEGQPLNSAFVMSGRDQAHAPNYQYNVGTQYRSQSGYFARVDVTGVDAFYFDNVHDSKSKRYALTNARIGYENERWEIYLWARNLFDTKYANRGFFFANDPSYGWGAEPAKEFTRFGDPRQLGVTTRIHF